MLKVVANEIVDLQLKRLRARNRWYLSTGFGLLALLGIGVAVGWSTVVLVVIGLAAFGYLIALVDHVSSIKALKKQLAKGRL